MCYVYYIFNFADVPSVQVLSNSYSVTLGNSITLECVVTATPTHTSVQWQRIVNGQTTNINLGTGNNKYSGSTVNTPSLTISASENSDEGYYTCSATNIAGTGTSQQTYLDVVGSMSDLFFFKLWSKPIHHPAPSKSHAFDNIKNSFPV